MKVIKSCVTMTSSNHEGNSIKIKYQTVETVPKSNRKIVERDKIDTPNQGRIQDFFQF